MSKCVGVLDSEKITEIRVKNKTQESQQKNASGSKNSDKSKQTSLTTSQQSK